MNCLVTCDVDTPARAHQQLFNDQLHWYKKTVVFTYCTLLLQQKQQHKQKAATVINNIHNTNNTNNTNNNTNYYYYYHHKVEVDTLSKKKNNKIVIIIMVSITRKPYHHHNGGTYRTTTTAAYVKSIQIVLTFILCTISYYTGTLHPRSTSNNSIDCEQQQKLKNDVLIQQQQQQPSKTNNENNNNDNDEEEDDEARIESLVQQRVHQLLIDHNGHKEEEEQFALFKQQMLLEEQTQTQTQKEKKEEEKEKEKKEEEDTATSSTTSLKLFQHSYSSIMNGIARISKDEFVKQFDSGPPMDKGHGTTGEDVLILYNKQSSIPTSNRDHTNAVTFATTTTTTTDTSTDTTTNDAHSKSNTIPLLSSQEATENCDTMNVVTIGNPGNTNQCTVLVNNYENYYIQRWMRVSPTIKSKIDHNLPLQYVSRGYASNGASQFIPPDENSIQKHWKTLYTYLDTLDDVLKRLKPIAESVVQNNTIIVMTCNMGQSELLMNFVCNAKQKGFDLGNILVFPTDVETKDLAEGLGLATFYDEKVCVVCYYCC